MAEQKTKRVRIAVAMVPDGQWNCCGWSGGKDDDTKSIAADALETDYVVVHFVEADIPIPEPQTIEGTVTE